MKKLKQYINEKQNFLIKNKNVLKDYDHYDYHPKTKKELQNIIIELLEQGETDLNCIDVSNITELNWVFYEVNYKVTVKDIDISEWDVSNVINMYGMFYICEKFNSDLSYWNVSNVKDMTAMFRGCKEFNADLSKWDVSNVKQMDSMFDSCQVFNSDLSKWNINNDVDMRDMFDGCVMLKKNKKIPTWYKGDV